MLHTSDWHVGKVLRGQPRADEHVKVLAEVVEIARAERPDLVIVAGDLYDSAAPSPESTRIVTRALSALRRHAGAVVAIAGNHDNGAALDALRPWATAADITVRGVLTSADDLLVTGRTEGGERWRVAALPWVSQRHAITAAEMFDLTAAEATGSYAGKIGDLVGALASGFDAAAVNIVTAHLTVLGGLAGGGEREAHTIQSYAVPATVFPTSTHYVALGHLHRRQHLPGPCPVHYCGSPLAIDFGEEDNAPGVLIVEVTADTPARVREVPITDATPLLTVRGTLDELASFAEADAGEGWLRVYVREAPRAGLREQVQELLPRALQVSIDPDMMPAAGSTARPAREGRSPRELFGAYLAEAGHDDPAVATLFDELYAEVS